MVMPKPQKMITIEMKIPKTLKPIKPVKHLPVPQCYIRAPYTMKKTGHVVGQAIICRKK
jgi:hypothetical protein